MLHSLFPSNIYKDGLKTISPGNRVTPSLPRKVFTSTKLTCGYTQDGVWCVFFVKVYFTYIYIFVSLY